MAECHTPLGYVWTAGGCRRSQYCSRASLSECDTWDDAVVVQSTRYGYKPISCSQDDLSTKQIITGGSLFYVKTINGHSKSVLVKSINPLAPKFDVQSNAEKTECPLHLLAQNMQSNEHPFISWVFCRVQWGFNSDSKRLMQPTTYRCGGAVGGQ